MLRFPWIWILPAIVCGIAMECLAEAPGLPVRIATSSGDWPWWRGLHRNGTALGPKVPVHLREGSNSDWKVPVPGRGHASPIVAANRIFLLSSDPEEESQFVVAFDRESGALVWRTELNRGGFAEKNHPKNTEASSTLACDGERVFAAICHHKEVWGVALSLEGTILWREKVGPYDPQEHPYGYAPSPIIYDDCVIYSYEYEGPSALVALDRELGKEKWRIERPKSTSYSTPAIAHHNGIDYLLLSGGDKVSAYDPRNGDTLWETPGTTMATSGTMVWHDGIAFASGGFPGAETIAVDLVSGEPLWRNRQKSYEQSMLVTNGLLLNFTDSGVLYCWDCKTGKELWKKRMGGPVSASGVVHGNQVFWANELGVTWVFEASPEKYIEIAKNQVGQEAFASPAICGGQIFIRTAETHSDIRQEYLIRFSEPTP